MHTQLDGPDDALAVYLFVVQGSVTSSCVVFVMHWTRDIHQCLFFTIILPPLTTSICFHHALLTRSLGQARTSSGRHDDLSILQIYTQQSPPSLFRSTYTYIFSPSLWFAVVLTTCVYFLHVGLEKEDETAISIASYAFILINICVCFFFSLTLHVYHRPPVRISLSLSLSYQRASAKRK